MRTHASTHTHIQTHTHSLFEHRGPFYLTLLAPFGPPYDFTSQTTSITGQSQSYNPALANHNPAGANHNLERANHRSAWNRQQNTIPFIFHNPLSHFPAFPFLSPTHRKQPWFKERGLWPFPSGREVTQNCGSNWDSLFRHIPGSSVHYAHNETSTHMARVSQG